MAATSAGDGPGSASDRGDFPQLTPHEFQVALLVAEGATNREAAEKLFVSPKTIEYHLGNIYSKLEVRSRTELARRFAGERGGAPA